MGEFGMFFSVVIPIYNAETTLERCLQSVIRQSFKDFEVIMVNDGSTDKSEEICIKYVNRDNRFRYYRQINAGVSVARNYGIDHARGEFITFLDSDDIYYIDYLQSFYMLINKFPGKDHYWCGFKYISSSLEQNGREVKHISDEKIVVTDRCKIMSLHEMTLDASPVNKVYRKEILNKYHIRMREDISLGEDLIFNFDYLEYCENTQIIIYNKMNYGYYCFSENSLNHRYRNDLKEIYSVLLDTMQQYIIKWAVSEEQKIIFYNVTFYMYDAVLRNTFCPKNTMGFCEKIRYNNAILKSERFQDALRNGKLSVNKVYKVLYQLGRYEILLMVDKLLEMKKVGVKKWEK